MGTNLYVSHKGTLKPINFDRDLNDDGYIDAVLINEWALTNNGFRHDTVSYIYWNSSAGFDVNHRDSFKTFGAEAAAIEDINNDGYEDIVVANSGYDITFPYVYIYYGNRTGFSYSPDDSILSHPNHGSISIGDVNLDGYLDILTSSWYGSKYSFLFYGGISGYDRIHCDSFLTNQAHGNKIADFDKNGLPDIFFAVYSRNNTTNTWSYIFYQKSVDIWEKDSLKTMGAGDDISVVDLNRDGFLDIVIPNHSSEPLYHSTYHWSYIYYGSANGFSHLPNDSLYTFASWSCSVGYLNDDTFPDIVFSNFPYDTTYPYSYIYYSRNGRFHSYPDDSLNINCGTEVIIADFRNTRKDDILIGSQAHLPINNALLFSRSSDGKWRVTDSLPAYGQDAGITQDAGNIYDISDSVYYISSVFDAYSIKEKKVICDTIFWVTQVLFHKDTTIDTSLLPYIKVFIRYGNGRNLLSINWSGWNEVSNNSKLSGEECRFIQYKIVFKRLYHTSICLKSISIGMHTPSKGGTPNVLCNMLTPSRLLPVLFPRESYSNIWLFDRNGRLVKKLYEGIVTEHIIHLKLPENIPSGLYRILINTTGGENEIPVLLIKN